MTEKNTADGDGAQKDSPMDGAGNDQTEAMKTAEATVQDILRNATGDSNSGTDSAENSQQPFSQQPFSQQPLNAEELAAATDDDVLGFGDARMDGEGLLDEPDLQTDEDPATLLARLSESEQTVASHWERLLRMQADMENQRKRSQKDVENARKFALEGLANELLPVKDSLEMGLQAASEDDADMAKIVEGSDLTLKMLSQALEKYKIVEVDPINEKFNPELHQAMSTQPAEGVEPNTVVAVLQKGYTLNERLIRPALVMIAK